MTEQVPAGGVGDAGDGGVRDLAFHGDGVKAFADALDSPDDFDVVLFFDLALDDRRGREGECP